jgi:multidrug transporter EmrE-like cation transporter
MTWQTIELRTLGWIVLASLVEAPALTLLQTGGLVNLVGASLIFAFGVVPLLSITLQYEGIGLVNFLWNILSTILMFGIGIFFFKEKIASLQVVGVILAMLGLGLVVISKE